MSGTHIADTGFFVALGQPENPRYQRVRTFARRNDIVFLVPERVYDELTEPISGTATIETAIDEGWAAVGDSLTYTVSLVSNTMDGVQRYIATADDRPEDEIERADVSRTNPASLRRTLFGRRDVANGDMGPARCPALESSSFRAGRMSTPAETYFCLVTLRKI